MKIFPLFLSLSFLAASSASIRAAECKEQNSGKCFDVHGRYNTYADGDAIWIIGTKRLLEASDDKLDDMLKKAGWEDHSIYGDFIVCPESIYQPPHKQRVCIQSYKNLKLGPWK